MPLNNCIPNVCVCVYVRGRLKGRECVKKDTAGFRWEIRNISIFITATWKTLECPHSLQQATQRKLAWGQISIVWWPERESERKGEPKTSNENHSWTFTIQTWWGMENKHCILRSGKPTHWALGSGKQIDTNLGFWEFKCQYGFYIL